MAVNEGVKTGHIIIEFKYKILDSKEWRVNDITVDEYFDFSVLEEGEMLDIDSVPMCSHLIEYFDDEHRQISEIFVSVTDKRKGEKRQFAQTFWNDQNSSILERIDTVGEVRSYHEFIIETLLPTEITRNPEKDYEIIRFSPEEGGVKCWYHGIIHDNADGSQCELSIEPKN